MMEKLECTRCEQKWEREKARGRKPIFCPACVELNQQEEAEYAEKSASKQTIEQDSKRVYGFFVPAPSFWICDHCDVTLKVGVGVTELPTHSCAKRRGLIFSLIQKTRQEAQRVMTA